MKKAYSFFSFSPDVNLADAARAAKEAGYDGVEPVMSESGSLSLTMSDAGIRDIGSMIRDLGLEIPSVGVWSLWDYNLVSDSSEKRARAREIVIREMEAAAILGADTVLVVPGYVACEFTEKPERIRYDIAYDRIREQLCALAPEAEKLQVSIGIENVWNKFLLSPLEVRRLIDEVDSGFVGVYFDVGNIIPTGYPEQWIEILGPRIKKIHFSDCRENVAGLDAFVDLAAGSVDFQKVMDALHAIGYDDYLTLEMLPNYRQYPFLSMQADKPALDFIAGL